MSAIDNDMIDPEIAAELDAIDATLAGDPVDPRYAEVAELALLLVAGRPAASAEFSASLDERVQRRFASAETEPRRRPAMTRNWLAPLGALATAGVAATVAVVVLAGSGRSGSSPVALRDLGAASTTSTSASASSAIAAPRRTALTPTARKASAPPNLGANNQAFSAAGAALSTPSVGAPAPVVNGRKTIQSAQLSLNTPPNRIDYVAQEVFNVVGREHGVVKSSSITASSQGYAQFQLSIPSSALQATMTALSQLRYASVSLRTDSTQDVNGQYLYDVRKLGDDRALRSSLLKQLAKATTTQQIDSLTAQIHDAEASIRSDESTLRNLNHQIGFSQIDVSINAVQLPVASHHSSGAFGLGKAAHDAGRVLTVAAGVALITLAALLPVSLVGALAWWIAAAVRRRRREQALDLA